MAGGLAWLREPVIGVLGEGAAVPDGSKPRAVLERFDLASRKATDLVTGLDWFEVSGDGEWLVVRDGTDLKVVPAQRKADPDGDDTVQVDLSRARFLADPAAQWRHAYAEAGRYMRHDFWVPDMAGVDWDGVPEEYRPVLQRVGTPGEFADLLWEVVGELGSSHAYIRPARQPGEDGRRPARAARRRPGPGPGRQLADRPGAARRVLRPARPVAAGRARGAGPGRATSCSPWTASRWTRWPGPARCWSAPRASRSS